MLHTNGNSRYSGGPEKGRFAGVVYPSERLSTFAADIIIIITVVSVSMTLLLYDCTPMETRDIVVVLKRTVFCLCSRVVNA